MANGAEQEVSLGRVMAVKLWAFSLCRVLPHISNMEPDKAIKEVTLEKAQSQLTQLIEAAAKGEVFIISKQGKPLVKVAPIEADQHKNQAFGFLKRKARIPDDFDSAFEAEIEEMFYGNPDKFSKPT